MTERIRAATSLDREGIRNVHLQAFPDGENQLVATLAVALLDERTDPEVISLVAEVGGGVAGHVAFSPVMADTGSTWTGYILAPLGVLSGNRKLGLGSRLVEAGMDLLRQRMTSVVFVYGDPGYYGRFGFSAGAAARYTPPCALKYPFGWQASVLHGDSNAHAVLLSCVPPLQDPALW